MENRYYTPKIEEFYIGFEYEVGDSALYKNIKCWYPEKIISFHDLQDINRYQHQRVKYLCKDDIKSLGFKDESILHPTVRIYGSEYKNQNGDNINLLYVERSNWCLIFAGEFGMTTWWDENNEFRTSGNIFAGYIKNKSELKKLLKMLNIKYNDKN